MNGLLSRFSQTSARLWVVCWLVILGGFNTRAQCNNALAGVSLSVPASVQLGAPITFSAALTNSGTAAGFGPFIMLAIDSTGADGSTQSGSCAPGHDGISTNLTATFLGNPLQSQFLKTVAFNDAANGGLGVNVSLLFPDLSATTGTGGPLHVKTTDFGAGRFQNGDTIVIAQIPLGSFSPGQPSATVTFTANTSTNADVGIAMNISGRAGFIYGCDSLDNPTTDPTKLSATVNASVDVVPELISFRKVYLGDESETATGPNYRRCYRLDAIFPRNQNFSNIVFRDILSGGMQFLAGVTVVTNGSTIGSYAAAAAAIAAAPHVPFTVNQQPSTSTPGGTLQVTVDQFTGRVADPDLSLIFCFFVPRLHSAGTNILSQLSCTAGSTSRPEDIYDILLNRGMVSALWTPTDCRDAQVTVWAASGTNGIGTGPTANPPVGHSLEAHALTIRKGGPSIVTDLGAPGLSSTDGLEYTLQLEVSDYMALTNIVINDHLADGQDLDTTFTPRLAWTEHCNSFPSVAMAAANFSVTTNVYSGSTPTNRTVDMIFRVSQEMLTRGQNGNLVGSGITNDVTGNSGSANESNDILPAGRLGCPTTATITYRSKVRFNYANYSGTGDATINPADTLLNTVGASASGLSPINLDPVASTFCDASSAGGRIPLAVFDKQNYAVNGQTNGTAGWTAALVPMPPALDNSTPNTGPGETITYRLLTTVPAQSLEDFSVRDYLPLPVYNASTVVTFTSTFSAVPPASGFAQWGPLDTYHSASVLPAPALPTITYPGANSIQFNFGSFSNASPDPLVIDILFTVTASFTPFADGVFLSNIAQNRYRNSFGQYFTAEDITYFQLREPNVNIYKAVVGYSNNLATAQGFTLAGVQFRAPGTGAGGFINNAGPELTNTPQAVVIGATDQLTNAVDGGDIVRFAIVLESVGRNDAFDVRIDDVIPPGFRTPGGTGLPGMNIVAQRGDGTVLGVTEYTNTLAGGTNLVIAFADTYSTYNFGSDIQTGALNRGYNASTDLPITSNGGNYLVVTFDLEVAADVLALNSYTNVARLLQYSGGDGTPNFVNTNSPPQDTATINIRPASATKFLTGTEIAGPNNSGFNQAVIGELIQYSIVVTVPEGVTTNVTVADVLNANLAFVDVTSFVRSSGVTSQNTITTGSSPANTTITSSGRNITFNLGNVTNLNAANPIADTITINFQAVVLNNSANQQGATRGNQATLNYHGTSVVSNATNVVVTEPLIAITKQVSTNLAGFGSTVANLDAGDLIYYRIRLTNSATSSDTSAFDLTLKDVIASFISAPTLVSVTAAGPMTTNGIPGLANTGSFVLTPTTGGTLLTNAPGVNLDMSTNSFVEITISGTLAISVSPNDRCYRVGFEKLLN